MQLQTPNQSFVQYTWYLVNLNPYLLVDRHKSSYELEKIIIAWLLVLSTIYSSILLKIEKRQLWVIYKLCDAGSKILMFR